MGIKCTVNDKKNKEITFPCLMRSKVDGVIVLFSSLNVGTVVCTGSDRYENIGRHAENWIFADIEEHWQPIQSVTLEMT